MSFNVNNFNVNNFIQNFYRNRGNLKLSNNVPNSNQPNIGALSTRYNRGIYSVKQAPTLHQQYVNELFTYFKYLTVVRAYQIDPNIIEQSTDPFIMRCVKISQHVDPYNSKKIINNSVNLLQQQQTMRAQSRISSPITYPTVSVGGGKRKR